ncbi:MAG TPA: hypothetical protein VKG65_01030 [Terriglobales bacterium]|nr:hypothetical protein [Terriglobales bacterium]
MAHTAEKDARDEVRLVAGNPSRMLQAEVRSTLGEVLLGQGRPHEARDELKSIHLEEYTAYDEIRWDTALAYVCAGDNDWHEKRITKSDYLDTITQAISSLDQIRSLEANRETQPFTTDAHALDARRPSNVCEWDKNQPGWQGIEAPHGTAVENVPNPATFELEGGNPSYHSLPPCTWEGVDFSITGAGENEATKMRVHIWGGGVDQRVEIHTGPATDHVLLTDKPQNTHDYYFAQLELENDDRTPVSYVYPIETFDPLPDKTCPKNAISLNFVKVNRQAGVSLRIGELNPVR